MWTAITTCRKQQRNFFQFLHSCLEAKLKQLPAPTLATYGFRERATWARYPALRLPLAGRATPVQRVDH